MRKRLTFQWLPCMAALSILAAASAGCGGSSKPAAKTTPAAAALVAPQGATYRYTVPSGFKLVPGTGPGQHLTTIIPAYLPTNSGTISAFEIAPTERLGKPAAVARFLAALNRQSAAFYRSHGGAVGSGTRTTIAGHPAMCLKVSHFQSGTSEGVVDGDGCAIATASVVVSQGCNWKPSARTVIEAGCKAVRASLKIS